MVATSGDANPESAMASALKAAGAASEATVPVDANMQSADDAAVDAEAALTPTVDTTAVEA